MLLKSHKGNNKFIVPCLIIACGIKCVWMICAVPVVCTAPDGITTRIGCVSVLPNKSHEKIEEKTKMRINTEFFGDL